MEDKLIANIKYFKHLCEKENLLYDEISNKLLIYRLIRATLEILNNVKN